MNRSLLTRRVSSASGLALCWDTPLSMVHSISDTKTGRSLMGPVIALMAGWRSISLAAAACWATRPASVLGNSDCVAATGLARLDTFSVAGAVDATGSLTAWSSRWDHHHSTAAMAAPIKANTDSHCLPELRTT